MNFPMDLPLFKFLYWFVNTAGLGGIAVSLVAGGGFLIYALTLRGIAQAGRDGQETFTYPTPSLHHPDDLP